MTSRIVLFSAHLDDAVLSATTQLLRPGAKVVTVFAGPPPRSVDRTRWDRITRAASSAERHRERIAEDEQALAGLGCAAVRMSEPENQYRTAPLTGDELAVRLVPHLAGATELWLPAGIGAHPDHTLLRDAGLIAAAASGPDTPVFVYADLPYTLRLGWPSRVTDEARPQYLDPDFWLDEELLNCGFGPEKVKELRFTLTGETRARKEQAVRCYRSQLPALRLTPDDPLSWSAFFRYELAWEVVSGG